MVNIPQIQIWVPPKHGAKFLKPLHGRQGFGWTYTVLPMEIELHAQLNPFQYPYLPPKEEIVIPYCLLWIKSVICKSKNSHGSQEIDEQKFCCPEIDRNLRLHKLTDPVHQAPNFLTVGWGFQQAARNHTSPSQRNKHDKRINKEIVY